MKKLVSFSFTFLRLLTIVTFFATCQKEYSYEGGVANGTTNGTAVYTFSGAGGTCTGNILSGKYYVGILLTAGNSIQLEVNVTTIGTYRVSSTSINGIYFSASGSFTDTGLQIITLSAIGTPVSTGSFTFSTPGNTGCSFKVLVEKKPVATASFTLQGAPNNCQNAVINGTYVSGSRLTASNVVYINVNVNVIGAYTVNTDTLDGISFSQTGTFTTTGIQQVTLLGSGTPSIPSNLTFTPSAGTSSCSFQITVQNQQPLATYVLESGFGNPAPCIYTLSGNYTRSVPLLNTNYIRMRVYVTVIGNFTIATNTVNGMTFSYTGTFTTIGAQYVILKGSGIPVTQGINTLTPQIIGPHPLGGEFCSFDVVVQ